MSRCHGGTGRSARPVGIAVINNLPQRGRRLGLDVFERARRQLPLELIGMDAERLGGREVPPSDVVPIVGEHRFLFSPIRYTSLGLAILEAMAAGVPVVGLATTELAAVVDDGQHGFIDTDVDAVIAAGARLLRDHALARQLGANARSLVRRRFDVDRFALDWHRLLDERAALGAACRRGTSK